MAETHRHVNPWIVAIAVMFGTFMEVLDTTVVNVSLPHIAASMSASIDESTWVLTSYLVANAIVLPHVLAFYGDAIDDRLALRHQHVDVGR